MEKKGSLWSILILIPFVVLPFVTVFYRISPKLNGFELFCELLAAFIISAIGCYIYAKINSQELVEGELPGMWRLFAGMAITGLSVGFFLRSVEKIYNTTERHKADSADEFLVLLVLFLMFSCGMFMISMYLADERRNTWLGRVSKSVNDKFEILFKMDTI